MICNKSQHIQDPKAYEDNCPICLNEKLNYISSMLKTLMLQVNNIEEQVIPKIEDIEVNLEYQKAVLNLKPHSHSFDPHK